MSQTIDFAALPEAARLDLRQQVSLSGQQYALTVTGTGWQEPGFAGIDWDEPVTVSLVAPAPGLITQITGLMTYSIEAGLTDGALTWTISSREAAQQPNPEETEITEVTIGLLDAGWSVLRSANGAAIPMKTYSKRRVEASGTGNPPITAQALDTATFAGVDILVTDYSHDTVARVWRISGEET